MICVGCVGRRYMEDEDARRFVIDWAADYLKEDSCHGVPPDPAHGPVGITAVQQYQNMSRALNRTGKRVAFDACWVACYPASNCVNSTPPLMAMRAGFANSWRVAMDGLSWGRALQNTNIGLKLSKFAGPGHWNNLGLMAFGHQSSVQNRAQFSLYCILASPLLLSGPLLSISAPDLKTYTNTDAIAINQDPLGVQGVALVGEQLCGSQASLPPPHCQDTMIIGKQLAAAGSYALLAINVGGSCRI